MLFKTPFEQEEPKDESHDDEAARPGRANDGSDQRRQDRREPGQEGQKHDRGGCPHRLAHQSSGNKVGSLIKVE